MQGKVSLKNKIIETAGNMFTARGYERTSIQDIIDILKISKGGFYHHFKSKAAVLEAVCQLRADASVEQARAAVDNSENSAVARFNALTASISPFAGDKRFAAMVLLVSYREDGVMMRIKTHRKATRQTIPILREIFRSGVASGELYMPHTESMAQLIIRLLDNLHDELIETMHEVKEAEAAMARIMETYRGAIEQLIGAPYGSIELYPLRELQEICRLINNSREKYTF